MIRQITCRFFPQNMNLVNTTVSLLNNGNMRFIILFKYCYLYCYLLVCSLHMSTYLWAQTAVCILTWGGAKAGLMLLKLIDSKWEKVMLSVSWLWTDGLRGRWNGNWLSLGFVHCNYVRFETPFFILWWCWVTVSSCLWAPDIYSSVALCSAVSSV